MEVPRGKGPRTFQNPEAEIAYLREELARREEALSSREGGAPPREVLGVTLLSEHARAAPAEVRGAAEAEGITLNLSPEAHDERMAELLHMVETKGPWYALAAVEASRDPHLVDDFHRVLVEYLAEGHSAKHLGKKPRHADALGLALFEVLLPSEAEDEETKKRPLKELISSMEQLYQGLLPSSKNAVPIAFEIANPAGSAETSVFVAVPRESTELFEKQILAVFPNARLERKRDDYNVFAEGGFVSGSRAYLPQRPIYALKTYDEFDYDPLNILLNSLSKLDRAAEGAAIQFIIAPGERGLFKRFVKGLEDIRKGVSIGYATDIKRSGAGKFFKGVARFLSSPKKDETRARLAAEDPKVKNIEKKLKSPLTSVTMRAVASGKTPERSAGILRDIEAAFQQFTDTAGNRIAFRLVPRSGMRDFVRDFSFRVPGESMPLSTAELATLAHLPPVGVRSAPEFRQSKAARAPLPPGLPEEGVVLGVNVFRNESRKVYLTDEDRLRHLYVIGQTGTGKSTLLKNIVLQDIKRGAGLCFIDPHGIDVLEILSTVPPERFDDVVYFDPAATERPMGLNMLEYDPRYPEQKTLVVDELLGIFKKLFGAVPESMGPAFEQYFRNATLLVMEDPASGSTLLDVARVFADASFRAMKLSRCRNPIVVQFWRDIAEQASGEQGLQNYAPYITNKFDVFTSNEIVRPIVSQQTSSFNFRDLMDERKIFLVNLAKGKIGDINANLLGLIMVGKFLMAALSRVDSIGKDLPPFYLGIDEFQNFTTPSIATIFSEARKYKLSLMVAHQFIAQLEENIRDAVFGNVGSICSFRVGPEDAEFLEKQFAPIFKMNDLMNIENRNAYVRLLARNKPEKPFSFETLPFSPGSAEIIDRLKELSYLKYGRERAHVEADIASRYERKRPLPQPDILERSAL